MLQPKRFKTSAQEATDLLSGKPQFMIVVLTKNLKLLDTHKKIIEKYKNVNTLLLVPTSSGSCILTCMKTACHADVRAAPYAPHHAGQKETDKSINNATHYLTPMLWLQL